jgi:hypothetical protein
MRMAGLTGVMSTKYLGYEGGGGDVQKIVNRNNRCTWDSGGDTVNRSDIGGLDILGMDGLEKEN